jgi:hypothetical protein
MGETEENIILAEREKEKREKEALRKHFMLDQVLEVMPGINNFLADQNFSNADRMYAINFIINILEAQKKIIEESDISSKGG